MRITNRLLYAITLLFLLVSSCAEGPYRGSYRVSKPNYSNGALPANPDPNKCYVRSITPDITETYTLQYLSYSTAEADEYPCNYREIEIQPASGRWEYRPYEGCQNQDPNDCLVLCFVTQEAKYVEIWEPTDSTLGHPQQVEIEITEIIEEGGLEHWEAIDCKLVSYNDLGADFLPNEAQLTEESMLIIENQLASLLNERPNIRVELTAHTDARGEATANMELSIDRANAVRDYLNEIGINPDRLITRGYGEHQLKNHCTDGVRCSEQEHAENERLEFRVINIDQ
ncbi:MAG: OmpA family protein [Bacteroidota bacterium]